MTIFQTLILSIIEGLTEFLPISSTAHLVMISDLMTIKQGDSLELFLISIQMGAISAVLLTYRKTFFNFSIYPKLLISLVPATILGLFLSDQIDNMLNNTTAIGISLILGGIILLKLDHLFTKNPVSPSMPSSKNAFFIGVFQTIALIPGVSRSGASIFGGWFAKMGKEQAVKYSFFLGVITIGAAVSKKMLDAYLNTEVLENNIFEHIIFGNLVSFFVGLISIKYAIQLMMTKFGFKLLGSYRIIIGTILLFLPI